MKNMRAHINCSSDYYLGVRCVLLLRTAFGRSIRLANRIPIEDAATTIVRRQPFGFRRQSIEL
jgi:hypothetical protein